MPRGHRDPWLSPVHPQSSWHKQPMAVRHGQSTTHSSGSALVSLELDLQAQCPPLRAGTVDILPSQSPPDVLGPGGQRRMHFVGSIPRNTIPGRRGQCCAALPSPRPQPKTARHGLRLTRLGLLLLAPLGHQGISAGGCLKECVIRFGLGAGALTGVGAAEPQCRQEPCATPAPDVRAVRSLPRGACAAPIRSCRAVSRVAA